MYQGPPKRPPNPEEKETIVQAAIQLSNGEIFKGGGHTVIRMRLEEEKRDMLDDEMKEGFVTSTGRFVSRKEAAKKYNKLFS